MVDRKPRRELSLERAHKRVNRQLKWAESIQRGNPLAALAWPADKVILDLVKAVITYVPSEDPVLDTLHLYIRDRDITDSSAENKNMPGQTIEIAQLISMLVGLEEALEDALEDEVIEENRRAIQQGSKNQDAPGMDFEPHYVIQASPPFMSRCRPGSLVHVKNELAYLHPKHEL